MHHIKTVQQLKDIGYKVKVIHDRIINGGIIQPKGGLTKVFITDNNGHTCEGISKCSLKDNFNKRLGLSIAIGRALNSEEQYVIR